MSKSSNPSNFLEILSHWWGALLWIMRITLREFTPISRATVANTKRSLGLRLVRSWRISLFIDSGKSLWNSAMSLLWGFFLHRTPNPEDDVHHKRKNTPALQDYLHTQLLQGKVNIFLLIHAHKTGSISHHTFQFCLIFGRYTFFVITIGFFRLADLYG